SEEGGNDADNEQQEQYRRIPDEQSGIGGGGYGLLHQAAHLLDHHQAVGGLHAGALQAVVVDRILVDGYVERGGFAHDFDADVIHVAVGKQAVKVVDGAREHPDEHRQAGFAQHQPPEVSGQGPVKANFFDAVDNVTANDGGAYGEESHQDTNDEIPGDHGGPGLPDKMQNGGDVAQSAQTFVPCAARTLG